MARYIDADRLSFYFNALAKHAETEGLLNMAHIHRRCLQMIEDEPTADVVPKSEVEELKAVIADHKASEEQWEELYNNAKTEVAREIFEEIEKHLTTGTTYYGHAIQTIGVAAFAELKKKYTEGEQRND